MDKTWPVISDSLFTQTEFWLWKLRTAGNLSNLRYIKVSLEEKSICLDNSGPGYRNSRDFKKKITDHDI